MQLRRGEFEQYANYEIEADAKVEEKEETAEEKPVKRGPGRPKKVVEPEVDEGTTAEDK